MRTRFFIFVSLFCVFSPIISATTIYVDVSATSGGNNGSSWADAYTAIQTAINNSIDYDEIIVAEGIYYENIDPNGMLILLTSTDPNDPGVVEGTVIDGGAGGSVITCVSGETSDTVITGFMIQNGNGDDDGNGGGISCMDSSPVIKNCIVSGNSASGNWGGGIFCWGGTPTISNSIFIGNTVVNYGGGIACYQSDVIVSNCVFNGNNAVRGGGFASYKSDSVVTNCTFTQNTTSGNYGDAVYCHGDKAPAIINSIMWGNTGSVVEIFLSSGSSPTVSYSVVEGGWTGSGSNNLSSDPLFIDADDDLYLDPFSLCINAGDPNYRGQFDMDGEKRVRYQRVDIGAYEVFPIGGDLNADEKVDLADLILFVDSDNWLFEVDLSDFALFASQWMYGAGPIAGDLNGDEKVDLDDLILFAASDMWLVEVDLVDFSLLAGNWMYGVD